jgi:TetR/AcrR family transcriptional regulator, ethionamide resistance regulator
MSHSVNFCMIGGRMVRQTARLSRQQSRQRIVSAATEVVRRRSYSELTVDEVMREAGLGRTIFYRHFDDLADLLMRASTDAVEELFAAQLGLVESQPTDAGSAVRRAFEAAAEVYQRHGPLLRCVGEAAASDEQVAAGYAAMLTRFDELGEQALRELGGLESDALAETAHALNLMNVAYLADAFGREPRVSAETAVQTLTDIWDAVIHR